MIILTEVATKLENILNSLEGFENPTPYYFQVETEGFHLDHIMKNEKDGNFIPVFISSMGGQFNPVRGLQQATYSIPIVFYYPVKFKDDFFLLAEFLASVFVGNKLYYGVRSGHAISNISVPQYGEIQNIDFKEFKQWADARYTKPIEVMEPYMSMQLTLYLSNAAPGLVYGNDIKTDLTFTLGDNTYTIEDVDVDGASLQSNAQANSEQEEEPEDDDSFIPESSSLPFGTAYGASFKVYPNLDLNYETNVTYSASVGYNASTYYYYQSETPNVYIALGQFATEQDYNDAVTEYTTLYTRTSTIVYPYKELLKVWLSGKIQKVECDLTFTIANDNELVYTRKCFIQSVVAPIEKGQLFSLTLTFAKKTELDEEVVE